MTCGEYLQHNAAYVAEQSCEHMCVEMEQKNDRILSCIGILKNSIEALPTPQTSTSASISDSKPVQTNPATAPPPPPPQPPLLSNPQCCERIKKNRKIPVTTLRKLKILWMNYRRFSKKKTNSKIRRTYERDVVFQQMHSNLALFIGIN